MSSTNKLQTNLTQMALLQLVLCLILILKLTQARYVFVPKFQGQDSAIIVDTERFPSQNNTATVNYPNKIRLPPPFPLWRHYPRYHIIPPPPGQIFDFNTWAKKAHKKVATIRKMTSTTTTSTTTTTTTTTTPKPTTTTSAPMINKFDTSYTFVNDDEFPAELLAIAQSKLGLKSLDEIPSITELGQLLGTNNSSETLKYMKQLTSNDQGVALLKAYIESTDYTDNSGDLNNKNIYEEDEKVQEEQENEDEMDNIEEPSPVNDEGLIVVSDEDLNEDYDQNNYEEEQLRETTTKKPTLRPRTTPKLIQNLREPPTTHSSFMERVINYMHLKDLFHKNEEVNDFRNIKKDHQIDRIMVNGEKVKKQSLDQENPKNSEILNVQNKVSDNFKAAVMAKENLPYNYPVPIRVPTTASTTTTTTNTLLPLDNSLSSNTPVVHLNTPKILIPHVKQLSRMTNIPTQNIADLLASKPKILELANKVSRLPIGYDRNSPMEAQVLAAIQKAINQDEDLKKLLSSTATLK